MATLSYILRMISLAFLFAGSSTIVFSAITLVHAAMARGMPKAEAAAANVPMFYMFGTVALVCALLLVVAEALDYGTRRQVPNLVRARYLLSGICVIACLVLGFGIIPTMRQLQPNLHTDEQAKAQFDKLHHASQMDFSAIIVCALVSLLLPGFERRKDEPAPKAVASSTPAASS